MARENKALKIVRARIEDAEKRQAVAQSALAAIGAEMTLLNAMARDLTAAYAKKRAVKAKPVVEAAV